MSAPRAVQARSGPAAGYRRYPLSQLQESLWAPGGLSAINVPAVARFPAGVDLAVLQRALELVVARHEALRTVLGRAPDGSLEQRVGPAAPLGIEAARHSGPFASCFAELLLAGSERPFRLAGGRLARAELHTFGRRDQVLIVWLHHVISDLVSCQNLAGEIRQACAGSPLPPVQVQLGEHAARERSARPDGAAAAYWAAALSTADSRLGLPLPAGGDHLAVRPPLPPLGWDVVEALGSLAAAHRTTLTAVLAAAVIALHAGQADSDRVVIGLTVSNRDRPQLRATVGCLADQLPLVVSAGGDPPFAELVHRVRGALLDAFEQRLPLGVLLRWLGRDRPPVFAVNLNFLPPRPRGPGAAAGADPDEVEFPYGVVKSRPDPWWLGDAVLAYRPRIGSQGLGGEIEGDRGVHAAAAVAGYGERFCRLLAAAARTPGARLSQLARC